MKQGATSRFTVFTVSVSNTSIEIYFVIGIKANRREIISHAGKMLLN